MKKKIGIWIILIIIGILLLGMLFFAVDSYRIKNDKAPIFAVQYKVLKDGGTTMYIGLGYKIIDYNIIDGNDKTYIGSLFMKYEDYAKENLKINNNETDKVKNTKYVPLEQLPKEYTFEQVLKDGCLIISYNNIYNKGMLDKFIENTGINSENRIPDILRVAQWTTEGDLILTDVEYTKEGKYKIRHDSTRDKFSREEDRIITTNDDFPGDFYGITETEEGEYIKLELALYAEICYADPNTKIYEPYIFAMYPKTTIYHDSGETFIGEVLEIKENLFFVKPQDNPNMRRQCYGRISKRRKDRTKNRG